MHHGLFSLTERDPQITISIQTEPSTNTLKVSVSDNGIGRYKAKQNQRKRMRKRPSMAMNIIRERINLIRKNADTATQIEAEGVLTIEDLTNQNKVGIGTTVTLRIPKTNLITRDKKRNAVKKFRNPFSLDWKEATQESL